MTDPSARPPITDSPWFWAMLFSAIGLVALLVMGPKYLQRQHNLELQFYAREEIVQRQANANTGSSKSTTAADRPPPGRGELIIPLWPLILLTSVLFVVSSAMLWRSRLTRLPADDD